MSRLEENKQILQKISNAIDKCPEMRFIQILWALNVVSHEDRYHEESEITKKIVDSQYKKLYNEE